MFALPLAVPLSVAAGAGIQKLLNKKGGGQQGASQEEIQKLKKTIATLEASLAHFSTDSTEKEARLNELRTQTELLKSKVETLDEEKKQLEEQNLKFKDDVRLLEQEQAALQRQRDSAAAEREDMAKQMDAMRAKHAQELKQYQDQLEDLRSQVSKVVSDLLARKLSNSEAADAIKALGCTIEYLEAPGAASSGGEAAAAPPAVPLLEQQPAQQQLQREGSKNLEWATQPTLLLEDRDKLERLVASGLLCNTSASGEGGASRIPLITFPSVRGLPDHVPSLKLKLPGGLEGGPITARRLLGDASQAKPPLPSTGASMDIGSKDQSSSGGSGVPSIAGGTPGKGPRTPTAAAAGGNGLKFVYSVQGAKGSQWVAKVPLNGDGPAPLAFFSSSGSPSAGAALLKDTGFSLDTGMGGSGSMGDTDMAPFTTSHDQGLICRP